MTEEEFKHGDTRTVTSHGWYSVKKQLFLSDWDSATEHISHRGMDRIVITKRQTWDAGKCAWLTDIEPVKVCRADGTEYPHWPKKESVA